MTNTNEDSSFVLFHHIYFSINLYPIIIHQFHSLDPTEESLASIHQTRYHEIQLTRHIANPCLLIKYRDSILVMLILRHPLHSEHQALLQMRKHLINLWAVRSTSHNDIQQEDLPTERLKTVGQFRAHHLQQFRTDLSYLILH